jgi:hypothetical protein
MADDCVHGIGRYGDLGTCAAAGAGHHYAVTTSGPQIRLESAIWQLDAEGMKRAQEGTGGWGRRNSDRLGCVS